MTTSAHACRINADPIAPLRRFGRDARGASAVEFALVAAPFLYMVLGIMQIGIYYMAQSALDVAVVRTAEGIRSNFAKATTPERPAGAVLKERVATNAGALVRNDSSLAVEIRQLLPLSLASIAIADGFTDYGVPTSPLVLRAQTRVTTFAPGFGSLAVASSSAIIRREGR